MNATETKTTPISPPPAGTVGYIWALALRDGRDPTWHDYDYVASKKPVTELRQNNHDGNKSLVAVFAVSGDNKLIGYIQAYYHAPRTQPLEWESFPLEPGQSWDVLQSSEALDKAKAKASK